MNYSNYFILTKDKLNDRGAASTKGSDLDFGPRIGPPAASDRGAASARGSDVVDAAPFGGERGEIDDNQSNELMYFENKNIYILPSKDWVYYKKNGLFEKPLINWCKQFCNKNKNLLDIGAQTGTYTISLAGEFNHVYSFEPHKNTYYALCGGIVLSKLKNVTCFQFGLGSLDQCGKYPRSGSTEHLFDVVDAGFSEVEVTGVVYTEEIKIKTLDQFKIDNISFIKIDVENNEYNILLGAKKTLKDSSYPMIILEVKQGTFCEKTIPLLKKYGYCIYNINGYTNRLIAIYNTSEACNQLDKFYDCKMVEGSCVYDVDDSDLYTYDADTLTAERPPLSEGSAVIDYFKVSNSYYDSGNFKKSIKFYNKFIETEKGFDKITKDKIFLSKLRKGICYKKIGELEKAIYFLLDAYDYYPERLESIYEIVYYYRFISKHRLAYNFYKIAKKIFNASRSEYILKFYIEYTIIAAYIGKYNINDKIVYIMNNSTDNTQLLSNMKFYKNILIQDKIINLDQTIEFYILKTTDAGVVNEKIKFYSSSSCMIKNIKKEGYILNIRYVNYYIGEKGNYIVSDGCDNNLISINKYIEMDANFNVLDNKFFDVDYTNRRFIGIEDLRLYRNKQNTIDFIGTSYHKNDKIGIVQGIYDIHNQKLVCNEIESPFKNIQCEKNWIYVDIEGEDTYSEGDLLRGGTISDREAAADSLRVNPHIIYKWYPLQIYSYERGDRGAPAADVVDAGFSEVESGDNSINLIKTINTPKIFSECRGSTCGVRVKTKLSKSPPIGSEWVHSVKQARRKAVHPDSTFGSDQRPPSPLLAAACPQRSCGLLCSPRSGTVSDGEWVFVEQNFTTEIWFVLHIVSCETPRHYYHIIAVFDVNMNILRYSAPFKFEGSSIEYCLSIIVEEERVLINYSTMDRTTRIGIYDRKYIESLLKYI